MARRAAAAAAALVALGGASAAPAAGPTPDDRDRAVTAPAPLLHAEGRGTFTFAGAGVTTVVLRRPGLVRVSVPAGVPVTLTATGLTGSTPAYSTLTDYRGAGTVRIEGGRYDVRVTGPRFTADVHDGAAVALGTARVSGRGLSGFAGGPLLPHTRAHVLLIARGPLGVRLSRGAALFAGGPMSGAASLTLRGRLRTWDRSPGRDLVVSGAAATRRRTLSDGSVLRSGLRGTVLVTGGGMRLRAFAPRLSATLTPAPATALRASFTGVGALTPAGTAAVRVPRGAIVRVLVRG